MMNHHWFLPGLSWLLIVAAFIIFSTPVWSGGVVVGDQGARATGRAGAFAARADDVSAMEYNPAMLATTDKTEFYLSNRFGYVTEEFYRAPTWDLSDSANPQYVTFDPVKNEKPWQLLCPMMGAATDFGLKDWGFAVGAYAPPGVSAQKFPKDGGQRYMLVERDIQILYYDLSAAWKFRDLFGIGASFQWVDMAKTKMSLVVNGNTSPRTVQPVKSTFDFLATVQGADHVGAAAVVGLWYRPLPFLQVAFSGRMVPVSIKAKSKLTLEAVDLDVGAIEPERNGVPADDVTFSMKLPMQLRAGIRYMHRKGEVELFDVELDATYESWHQTDDYVVNAHGITAEVLGQEVMVDKIIIPKSWKDTFSIRLGGDYNVLPGRLALRAGGFYESAAAQAPYAYIDFIASQRLGASAGTSVMFFGFDISVAYSYIFEWPFVVSEDEGKIYQQMPGSPCKAPYTDPANCNESYLGKPAATSNAGVFASNYHFITLSLSYGF